MWFGEMLPVINAGVAQENNHHSLTSRVLMKGLNHELGLV